MEDNEMKLKRKLAAFLTGTMLLSTMSAMTVTAGAANYSDTAGHWAESAVDRWSGYGIVQGSGGAFRPNASMTRAEMATVLSKLLGLTDKASNSFADVSSGAWYADAVLKCAAAGILKGDGTGANPNGTITREEAAVMMGRALAVEETSGSLSFADGAQVSGWAKGYVKAMSDKGIVNGVGSNRFAPAQNIDRASVVTILDRTITGYANTAGATVEAKNAGLTLVAAPDVTITGAAADVLVAAGAASGTVTLSGASVSGAVTVQAKADVALMGSASVGAVELTDAAAGATLTVGAGAKAGTVSVGAEKAKVEVAGTVTDVTIDAANVAVTAQKGGTIDTVTTTAKGTTVAGEGTVKTVKTNDKNDTKVTTKNTKVEQTGGAAEKPSTGGGSGGGGGGGHSSNYVETTVTTTNELQKAAAQAADAIKITVRAGAINPADPIVISSGARDSLTIDFGTVSAGDVTIEADTTTAIVLSKAENSTSVFRTLTINAPNAEVVNDVAVGSLIIKAVKLGTMHQNAAVDRIRMEGTGAVETPVDIAEPPHVTVATSEPVKISGTVDSVAVTEPMAVVTVAATVEKTVSSMVPGTKLTVESSNAKLKLDGSFETVNVSSTNTEIDTSAGTNIAKVETAAAAIGAKLTGEGSVTAVDNKADGLEVSAASVGEITTTAAVRLDTDVEKVTVPTGAQAVSLTGSGMIGEVSISADVTVNAQVAKVTVEAPVTLTVSENITIAEVQAKSDLTLAGAGSVSSIDVTVSDVRVTVPTEKMADTTVSAVGDAQNVKLNDSTDNVKKKAAAPTPTYTALEEAGAKVIGTENCEYSMVSATDEGAWTGAKAENEVYAAGTYYFRVKSAGDVLASPAVKLVIPKVYRITGVSVSGTPLIGETLIASVMPSNATDVKYQWEQSEDGTKFTAIEGATNSYFKLTDAQAGKCVQIVVTSVYTPNAAAGASTITVTVDKSKLISSLSAAKSAMAGVAVAESADTAPKGTLFVTAAEQKTLTDTIAAAEEVAKSDAATTDQVTAHTKTLNDAVTVFNTAKKMGTLVSTDALKAAAADAAKNLASVVKSADGKDVLPDQQWATAAVYDAYSDAIKAAETKATQSDIAEAELDAAVQALNAATTSFNGAKQLGAVVDKAALNAAIASSQQKLATVTESTNGEDVLPTDQWATADTIAALNEAVDAAQAEADKVDSTASSVTAAITELTKAADVFKSAPGTKDIVAPSVTGASAKRTAADQAEVVFTSNENGHCKYAVVAHGASAPTAYGADINVTAGKATKFTAQSSEQGAWDIYVAVSDGSSNTTTVKLLAMMYAANEIDAAPLHDESGAIADGALFETGSYKAAAGTAGADGVIPIIVEAKALLAHQNGGEMGHWVGFYVKAPVGAEKVNYALSSNEEDLKTLTQSDLQTIGTVEGFAFYANASAVTPKIYASLQWCDQKGIPVSDVISYKMDLSGVSFGNTVTFQYTVGDDTQTVKVVCAEGAAIGDKAPDMSTIKTFAGWYKGETKWDVDSDKVPAGGLTLEAKIADGELKDQTFFKGRVPTAETSKVMANAMFAKGKDVVVEENGKYGITVQVGTGTDAKLYTYPQSVDRWLNTKQLSVDDNTDLSGNEKAGLVIFAGGYEDSECETSDRTIEIRSGKVGAIFGGGYVSKSNTTSTLNGTTTIKIAKDAVAYTVWGGGAAASASTGSVQTVKTNIDIWGQVTETLHAANWGMNGVSGGINAVITLDQNHKVESAKCYIAECSIIIEKDATVGNYYGGGFSYSAIGKVTCDVYGSITGYEPSGDLNYSTLTGSNGYVGECTLNVKSGGSVTTPSLFVSQRGYIGTLTLNNEGTMTHVSIMPDGRDVDSFGEVTINSVGGTIQDLRIDCGEAKKGIKTQKPYPSKVIIKGNVQVNTESWEVKPPVFYTVPAYQTIELFDGATFGVSGNEVTITEGGTVKMEGKDITTAGTYTFDGNQWTAKGETAPEATIINAPAPENKAEEPAVQPEPVQPEPTQPEDTAKPEEPVQSEPQVEVPEEKPAPNNESQIVAPADQDQPQSGETPIEETTPAEPTTEITTPDAPANDEPVVTAPANEI